MDIKDRIFSERAAGLASKNGTICSVEVIKQSPLSAKHGFHYNKSVANAILNLITI